MEVTEIKTETVVKEMNPIMADQDKINNIVTDVAVIKTEIKHLVAGHAELLSTMKNISVVPMEVFLQAKKDAEEQHKKIYEAIEAGDKDIRTDLDKLITWKETIISKLAYGAVVFLIIIVLVLAGLDKFNPL